MDENLSIFGLMVQWETKIDLIKYINVNNLYFVVK